MLKFLPKNLNLEKLLKENPPDFKYHIDHFVHLCSLLFELPAKKKDAILKDGFVPLNSFLLKKVNNKYKKYFNYMIMHGVIECKNSYIPGERSKSYRFTQKYQDIIRPVRISKHTLTRTLKQVHRFNRGMFSKYKHLHLWFDDKLQIRYEDAEQKLMEIFNIDKEKEWNSALVKLNANMVNLIKFHNRDYSFTVDSTSHRLHTLFSKIKKELRDFISYNGIPLANIDIQCSQPTLSLCLLNPSFYTAETQSNHVRINRIDPSLTEILPMNEIASYVKSNQDKFEAYRQIVLSDMYTKMGQLLRVNGILIPEDPNEARKKVKEMMFTVLYSSNRFIGGEKALPKRIFKRMFPEVYEVFRMYKSAGEEKLPILLQKIESRLILDNVTKTIAKKYKAIPLYTIHDSIVCPADNIDACKIIFEEESHKLLGFVPTLKIDLWGTQ